MITKTEDRTVQDAVQSARLVAKMHMDKMITAIEKAENAAKARMMALVDDEAKARFYGGRSMEYIEAETLWREYRRIGAALVEASLNITSPVRTFKQS